MSLDALFSPASVAIVGASQREDSIGFRVIRNLRRSGFAGAIHPVHPSSPRAARSAWIC